VTTRYLAVRYERPLKRLAFKDPKKLVDEANKLFKRFNNGLTWAICDWSNVILTAA